MRLLIALLAAALASPASAQFYVGGYGGGFGTGLGSLSDDTERLGFRCPDGGGSGNGFSVRCDEPGRFAGAIGGFAGYDFMRGPMLLGIELRAAHEFGRRSQSLAASFSGSSSRTQAFESLTQDYSYSRPFSASIGPRIGVTVGEALIYAHAAAGIDVFNERWRLSQRSEFVRTAPVFEARSFAFDASASRTSVAPAGLLAAGVERDFGGGWFARGEAFVGHAFWSDSEVRDDRSGQVFPARGQRTTYGLNLGVGLRF